MKAFTFRLEKALRWRETQVKLQKSCVAREAARVSAIQTLIEAQAAEARDGAAELAREPLSGALSSYTSFLHLNRARSDKLTERQAAAKRALAVEMEGLVEANRKLHLVENLKSAGQGRWRKEFERGLAEFADEAFLAGIQSRKRTGA